MRQYDMSFKISVAMCTYNGEKYVHEQLESIIKQTKRPDEIIVCDDGSTDKTANIVQNMLKESGINYRVVKNPTNLGFIKNFEKAISLCTGDIIFLSDQDDFWLENKIEKTEKVFVEDDKCMLVFSDMDIVDEKLSKIGINTWEQKGIKENLSDIDILTMISQKKDVFNGCAMAIRSTAKDVVLPFTEKWGHDLWIIANVALFFDNAIRLIPDRLVLHRRHLSNTSKANYFNVSHVNKNKNIYHFFRDIKKNYINVTRSRNYDKDRFYVFLVQIRKKKKVIENKKRIILQDVYEYYNRKVDLEKKSVFVGIFEIINDLIKGLYYKYQNSVCKAAVKDVLYLFFKNYNE